jgi:ribosomal protein L37AE/L43A
MCALLIKKRSELLSKEAYAKTSCKVCLKKDGLFAPPRYGGIWVCSQCDNIIQSIDVYKDHAAKYQEYTPEQRQIIAEMKKKSDNFYQIQFS